MKYSKEARLEIGKKIHQGLLSYGKAMEDYDISCHTVRSYVALYQKSQGIDPKGADRVFGDPAKHVPLDLMELQAMSKEELIMELAKGRIA